MASYFPFTKTIEQICTATMGQCSTHGRTDTGHEPLISEALPPRRFTDETLARLATISSTVQCECARHLAELLTSLAAFEQYSTENESRSIKDVALDAYLNATASRARHMIEIAPTQLLESGPTCCLGYSPFHPEYLAAHAASGVPPPLAGLPPGPVRRPCTAASFHTGR